MIWKFDKYKCTYSSYDEQEDILIKGRPKNGDIIEVSDTFNYVHNITKNEQVEHLKIII